MNDTKSNTNLLKIIALLFLGFLLLLAARFVYSFFLPPQASIRLQQYEGFLGPLSKAREASILNRRSNLSQLGISVEGMVTAFEQGALNQLQILEETGSVSATTTAFDDDKRKFLAIVEQRNGKIMHEQMHGLKPHRYFSLTFGVSDQTFQDTLKDIQDIGQLVGLDVTRIDRTEEFRALFAEKQSAGKHLEALMKLRQVPGKIDLVSLEQKILEIEKEIVSMAMKLGDYTPEESLSNISYMLKESKGVPAYTLDRRLLDSLLWSLFAYRYVVGIVIIVALVHRSILILRG